MHWLDGRTAPRTAAMDTFRWGSGGTSLGKWEHNKNEIVSQTDKYLVKLSSKTYVFEDKMTKY